MARIVELCGIAGVGKSTIFKAMISKWNTSADWVPGHFLYPQEKLRFDTLSKFILSVERKLTTGEGNIDERAMKAYGDRFLTLHPAYIDACWNNIFSREHKRVDGLDIRFDKARYLYSTLQKFQFLKESETGKTTVIDEGLTHRIANGMYRGESPEKEREEIYHLVRLMPLPDALVYVDAETEEVVQRLVNRRKVILSHQSMSQTHLQHNCQRSKERMAVVIKNMESRNVPILRIDAKTEIAVNAASIIDFVESVHKEKYAWKQES